MSELKLILVDENGEESDLGTVPFDTDIAIAPMAAAISQQLTSPEPEPEPEKPIKAAPESQPLKFWVSPTGKASWKDAASELCPDSDTLCASLETANENAAPGDRVFLTEGTYETPISPKQSGTEDDWIYFYGAKAKVSADFVADHITLVSCSCPDIKVHGNGNQFKGCDVEASVELWGDYNSVRDCIAKYVSIEGDRNIVRSCILKDSPGAAIEIDGIDNIIRNNRISAAKGGVVISDSSNRIYNNTFRDISESYAIEFGKETRGNVAKNNLIIRATSGGFDPASRLSNNNLIVNNFEGNPDGEKYPALTLTDAVNPGINSNKLRVRDCLYFAAGDAIDLGGKRLWINEIDYANSTLYIDTFITWEVSAPVKLADVENIGAE